LYVSVLLRPPAHVAGLLTIAGGVALCEGVVASTGLATTIKWPNDLLAPDGKRKLAGILVEGSAAGDRLEHVVFGYGINLRSSVYPAEIRDRVTSIEEELGRSVDANLVLQATLDALDARYADLLEGRAGQMLARWTELAPRARGARVEWTSGGVTRRGVSAGIDRSGALLVQTDAALERVLSADVRWL
jgi:BirA family biotin operon repressor/biotin-[acetyl-CoA-carboxylase] ligase